jgi:anaerobic ribonucleoside-triphosphate reductase
MRFPYTVFPARPDAAFPDRQTISRPIVTVTLERGALSIATFAIVDSGADNCLFPASLAAQLGIAIPNQNTYVFSGTSEQGQIAYFETMQVTVWNGQAGEQPLSSNSMLDSATHLSMSEWDSSGRKDSFLYSRSTSSRQEISLNCPRISAVTRSVTRSLLLFPTSTSM